MPRSDPGFAAAKLNLALHVTGQREDGYHFIDSLVVFANIGDHLRYTPGGPLALGIDGPFSAGLADENNLILRAARLCEAGGQFHLMKTLPVASGIGGGSADAAAALRLLAKDGWPMPEPDAILSLGADVPVCLRGESCLMRGIGEKITPVDLPCLPLVLVNPRVAVPTGAVFSALSRKDNPPMTPMQCDLRSWLSEQRNDLEAPARDVAPVIAEVLESLADEGAWLSRMSGSGATCFGLFETCDEAERAAAAVLAAHPSWWVKAGQTTRETTKSGNS